MMESIVDEKLVSFKTLEQEIFSYVCELARIMTQTILERKDDELAEGRDKAALRDKGKRPTTIKTVYGEVTYSRRVYQKALEDGRRAYVYLLDETMHMDKIGLISTNLAEKIALAVTVSPYRVAADEISATCGQDISAMGVWGMMQRLGRRIEAEEAYAVQQMEAGRSEGKRETQVLFEEMDGVWLHMQGRGHKKVRSREMKVSTMYEGWDAEMEKQGRSTLVGRRMYAGMENSNEFHAKREACISKEYQPDEIGQRILNGDGGGWIKDPYDPEAIFQLDRFHIYQGIRRYISDKGAQSDITELFDDEKTGEMLDYIKTYAESIGGPAGGKAMKLYNYLNKNKEGLLPYDKRGIPIPEPPEGIIYKQMGVQEAENCTVITLRMKNRRMRWSKDGANSMAKALYRKVNRELIETIDRYQGSLIFKYGMGEIIETLSAAKAPKKDGKGNSYVDIFSRHMPLLDAVQTASRKAFKEAFCQ